MVEDKTEALRRSARDYHTMGGRPGKLEVVPTKPCLTARDLSLAYTPGVAYPCLDIEKNPEDAYKYTNKGNLVAVFSNGTAVLGLGDIGALAGKPVMEGKGVLFKRFAHVDVFDIEVNTHDPEEMIKVCQLLEPTFGGINLEDIKAPECFVIEDALKKTMNIPVFHDDQHGTAIISGAALLNACELTGRNLKDVRVVVSGAGAAAIACAKFYELMGVPRQNFILVDSKGVVYKGRTQGMNPYKEYFAIDTDLRTLAEAMKGADLFLGLSVKDLVTQGMVKSMADNPIVFAMANPDPEITYPDAKAARPDVIMATGRSDYPNQVNNVLGFPFIFRGALDVKATAINEEMKLAAAHALAALAKEPVPENVSAAYGGIDLEFGRDYIIPKPFDPRVLYWEAPAVAKAACETGVAKQPITDWEAYVAHLEGLTSKSAEVMRTIMSKAKRQLKRIVFAEGEEHKILHACKIVVDDAFATPVLLGNRDIIEKEAHRIGLNLSKVEIHDPQNSDLTDRFAQELHRLRGRAGVNTTKAKLMVKNPLEFGAILLSTGMADGMIAGVKEPYVDTIKKVLPLIPLKPGISRAVGMHLIMKEGKVFLCADTTVNIDPDTELLVEIALIAAQVARHFNINPRIAMLSFSNFGDNNHPKAKKVRDAVAILHEKYPDLCVDGEMHGDVALMPEWSKTNYPQAKIQGNANVLIFPDLQSGNIAYKLITHIGRGEVIGPMIIGLQKPINVISFDSDVREITNMAALSASQAGA
jgi:malate dehydrogenase (oxaloacetate-decarboxylating)(NADP+)